MYKYNIVQLGMHIFVYSLAQLKLIKSWVTGPQRVTFSQVVN